VKAAERSRLHPAAKEGRAIGRQPRVHAAGPEWPFYQLLSKNRNTPEITGGWRRRAHSPAAGPKFARIPVRSESSARRWS
jgi:hypothetical protein